MPNRVKLEITVYHLRQIMLNQNLPCKSEEWCKFSRVWGGRERKEKNKERKKEEKSIKRDLPIQTLHTAGQPENPVNLLYLRHRSTSHLVQSWKAIQFN